MYFIGMLINFDIHYGFANRVIDTLQKQMGQNLNVVERFDIINEVMMNANQLK